MHEALIAEARDTADSARHGTNTADLVELLTNLADALEEAAKDSARLEKVQRIGLSLYAWGPPGAVKFSSSNDYHHDCDTVRAAIDAAKAQR